MSARFWTGKKAVAANWTVPLSHSWLRLIGIIFWVAILVAAAKTTRAPQSESMTDSASTLEYLLGSADQFETIDHSGTATLNEPVFMKQADGAWKQVGHISALRISGEREVTVDWYDRNISPEQVGLAAYQSTGQLEEVLATMLPPAKREEIRSRLESAFREHGEEIMRGLMPIAQQTLQQSLPVIEAEFRKSVDRHRLEIDQLANRLNDELVDERLIPLAQREIVPIVRKHGEPIAETIGRELWDRASLWRFGWRAAYDRSPLPQRDLVQGEWDRFVEQEAIPVFDRHMDEIAVAVQRSITDIAANKAVREELAEVGDSLSRDPETVRLVRSLLKESIVDNPELHQVWRNVWSSDEARRAIDLTGDRLEPVARQIGDDLFGTREGGINPDFARVLRNQILGKDRRWIVATPISSAAVGAPAIERSGKTMPYPIVYLADEAGPPQ